MAPYTDNGPRMTTPNPTEGELAILRVLWSRSEPMTVREVHEVLSRGKDTGWCKKAAMDGRNIDFFDPDAEVFADSPNAGSEAVCDANG